MEEEIAKTLSALEQSSTDDTAKFLRLTYIASAEQVEYPIGDEVSQYFLIRIPYRSLQFYRKISNELIDHLEEKFNWPVIIVANRKIQSKRGKLISFFVDALKFDKILTFLFDYRENSCHPKETKNQNSQGCSPGFPQ